MARIDTGDDTRSAHAACMQKIAHEQCRRSFGTIFEHYAPRLKSYVKRMGADDAVAEEVVQDVMLTVWRKAAQFDGAQASVSTWIFRIARNRQIDLFRQSSRPDLSPDEPMLRPEEPVSPDDILTRSQVAEQVRELIHTLPPEQIELLKAAFYQGLSHSEIAKAYDLPLGTVKSRIRLAFDRLRGGLRRT